VLDLSKVEAGKMEVSPAEVSIEEMRYLRGAQLPSACGTEGADARLQRRAECSHLHHTDPQRLQQVLKNLVGNAIKFTSEGGVTVSAFRAEQGRRYSHPQLLEADSVIAFAVTDTGIGIPDKQRLIFEAFQQADGTTSRSTAARDSDFPSAARSRGLLGGEIAVESEPGKGSTFTLYIPAKYVPPRREEWEDAPPAPAPERRRRLRTPARPLRVDTEGEASGTAVSRQSVRAGPVPDDRAEIQPGDRVVLIVENDDRFARVLLDMAREKGFKGIVELDGEAGLEAAHDFHPDAITLDIDMPGVDGWAVLERLKHHAETRHIPVHIISGLDDNRQQGLRAGAIAYLEKPVSKEGLEDAFGRLSEFLEQSEDRNLLVVEDDAVQRDAIVDLIAADDVTITAVSSAEEALSALEEKRYDCMVLDLGLSGTSGFELLEQVKSHPERRDLPIIVYTGKDLSREEETRLRKYAETIIVKDVKSPERLLDETALFLHRVESSLPEQKRQMLRQLHTSDAVVAGKRVLVVDDDVRNIYSLTSLLESHGMHVEFAEDGREALAKLEADPGVDVVLMDVMMPELDGYETMKRIRQDPRLRALPIIALTAKAMKGDREKCVAAGASDYITKPVEPEQLLSLLRVWLYR
jgi:CheY-like chemotaxis protein